MISAIARSGILLALAALLQSCGGGGGGGPGGANPPVPGGVTPVPRVSVNPTSIAAAATPGNLPPRRQVELTVNNPPAGTLYLEITYGNSGIDTVSFVQTSSGQGTITVVYRNPGSLVNSVYADTVNLRVCTTPDCTTQIAGSPIAIGSAYAVNGNGTSTAAIDRSAIEVRASTNDPMFTTETARVTVAPAPDLPLSVWIDHASTSIRDAYYGQNSATGFDVVIEFTAGQGLGAGAHPGTVTVRACYDPSCVRQVQGSPFEIATNVIVNEGPEPGVAPLDVASRVALPHDVVDAEYSKALNRIVMAARYPANALYVYDVATATEQQLPLNRAPSSVSVSPDGLTAAVGQDAMITVVDLATLGQPGAPAPVVLDVTTNVFDLVLDGRGFVHAWPPNQTWREIHSVEIATNVEQISTGAALWGGAAGRLHPSGAYLYTADNGLSPSDIEKWDIRSGRADWMYDSPYHGDYAMCGNLWFDEGGATIYTACGNTFRASSDPAQDMLYDGALELYVQNFNRFSIRALSQSAALGEIALIEYDLVSCDFLAPSRPCYSHLAFYESEFLNRQALYSIAPVTVDGIAYGQRGLFVFHDAVGTNKYLISRLRGAPDPDVEYYLSVVP